MKMPIVPMRHNFKDKHLCCQSNVLQTSVIEFKQCTDNVLFETLRISMDVTNVLFA